MTRSPVTPHKPTPYTPTSFTSRLMTPLEGFALTSNSNDQMKTSSRGEQLIHQWLRSSSVSSLSPDVPSITLVPSPNPGPKDTSKEQTARQRTESFLLDAASVYQYESPSDLFNGPSVDLNLELCDSSPVLDKSIDQGPINRLDLLFGGAHLDDLSYIPEIDGDLNDENILRRNRLDPWPYDRKPLSSASPHSLPAAGSHTPHPRERPAFKSRPILSRHFSSSFLRGRKRSPNKWEHQEARLPNSAVPHPDWGSFPFESANDDLDSDEEDNDVQIWLARVVRRNHRTARDALAIARGCHRAMTIEDYERYGSWMFEYAWKQDLQVLRRTREEQNKLHRASSPPHKECHVKTEPQNDSRLRSTHLPQVSRFEMSAVDGLPSLSLSCSSSAASNSCHNSNHHRHTTPTSSLLRKMSKSIRDTLKVPLEQMKKIRRSVTPSTFKRQVDRSSSSCSPAPCRTTTTSIHHHSFGSSSNDDLRAQTSPFGFGSLGSFDSQLFHPTPLSPSPSHTTPGRRRPATGFYNEDLFSGSSLRLRYRRRLMNRYGRSYS